MAGGGDGGGEAVMGAEGRVGAVWMSEFMFESVQHHLELL